MMNACEQLIQELDEARTRMREITALVSEKTEIYETWKMKEVLAHIYGWEDVTISALQAHAQGKVPTALSEQGIDEYNAIMASSCQKLPYATIVHEWENTREQLKEVLSTYPEDKFAQPLFFPWGQTGTVTQIIRIMIEHEHEHADEIRELVK